MKIREHLLLLLMSLSLPSIIYCELFTALVDLERLLHTEGEIVRTLEKYLEIEEKRLQKVRGIREEYEKLYLRANEDVQTFLSNPVNAYLLVKRLTADWKITANLIQGHDSRELIENITQNRADLQFPDDEDLSGAAVALMRLQDTYKLDTASLARGLIEGTIQSPELTAGDCFELGKQAHNADDFYHTFLWVEEALNRLEKEDSKTAEKGTLLEYIAWSAYKNGNMKQASEYTKQLLDIVPDHPRAPGNLEFYENTIKEAETKKRGDDGDEENDNTKEAHGIAIYYPADKKYFQLCRGERVMSDMDQAKLYCRLFTNNHPFLLLQPVKEEELFLKPRIVVYHNFLSESEMEIIKSLALPKLQRATVQNSESGSLEIATYRISKSAWLRDIESERVAQISKRIGYVTSLSINTVEELQVVNYGIGGHYEPHFDFARKEEANAFKGLGTGNRIATWLNYMSDVEAGGATVFPKIGIGVKPEKGSAAFWYNLLRNGDGDELTMHAACPVLAGSKWVSNKWFHEYDQEFRRQCSLDPTV